MTKVLYQASNTNGLEKLIESLDADDGAKLRKLFGPLTTVDFNEAVDTMENLVEKYPNEDELRLILAKEYFLATEFGLAEKIYKELIKRNPNNLELHAELGKTFTARNDHRKAIAEYAKAEKIEEFLPYYFGMYAKSLDENGSEKRAREFYHKEIEHYITTGDMYDEIFIDGCFQQIIEIDARIGSAELKADVEVYKDFLQKMPSTDQIKDYLSDLIVALSQMLGNKWIRQIFIDFVKYVDEKGYLKEYPNSITISSAYTSYESWLYNEDPKIGKVLLTILKSGEIEELEADPDYEEYEGDFAEKLTFLTYKWLICHEYEELKEQIDRVREVYPHTYCRIADLVDQIESRDRNELLAELEKNCAEFSKVKNVEKMHSDLEAFAKIKMQEKKRDVIVANGSAPYRNPNKIMPNDPCPCGSGKKYKKCCGR